MNLQPHQQRVVDEKAELDERIEKLDAFLHSARSEVLTLSERGRMARQLELMQGYSFVLGERIAAFITEGT